MNQIEESYKKFLASKLTLEDYFKISILYATRFNADKFNIKPNNLKYDRVIMVFRDHPKNPDDYFLGQDFSKLHSKSPIEIKIESLMSMLGKSQLGDLLIEDMCTVYKLENTKDCHGKKVIRGYKHYSVPGGDGDIKVGVWEWNLDAPNTIFWLPSENLIENLYRCDKTPSCGYTTKRLQDMDAHKRTCTDEQQITPEIKPYGGNSDTVSQLTEMFNLDFNQYPQEHFVVYDIETFPRNGILVPVSIAVSSTLTGPMYFERKTDDPKDGFTMVSQFLDYLEYLHRELLEQLPSEINEVIEHLENSKDNPSQYNQSDKGEYFVKQKIRELYNYVANYQCLKVFGFNSRNV